MLGGGVVRRRRGEDVAKSEPTKLTLQHVKKSIPPKTEAELGLVTSSPSLQRWGAVVPIVKSGVGRYYITPSPNNSLLLYLVYSQT